MVTKFTNSRMSNSPKMNSSRASCCAATLERCFVGLVCQRHLDDPRIFPTGLAPQEALFSSSFDCVVTNEESTCINFDTALTETPFFLSKSAKAINIIHYGPVMPSTSARV